MKEELAGSKVPFNFRLTPAGKILLVKLGEHMGLTRSGVIETAIRLLAKEQGLPGGYATRAEIDTKWKAFMEEDEIARTTEINQSQYATTEQAPKGE